MKNATRAWIKKAEGDFNTAAREFRVKRLANHNAVCFHVQQCVEKYLKARLEEGGLHIPKTHDLEHLLHLLVPVEPLWAPLAPSLRVLTQYAVEPRYPGKDADRVQAKEAVARCREIRRLVRASLGLRR